MSELTSNISDYFNTGEINFKIENKKDAMEDVKNYFFAKNNLLSFMISTVTDLTMKTSGSVSDLLTPSLI